MRRLRRYSIAALAELLRDEEIRLGDTGAQRLVSIHVSFIIDRDDSSHSEVVAEFSDEDNDDGR